ncbi:MAG TPA: hypothetical protein VFS00_32970, partial [Polyangiaceae bacterium]|nr:hypothetical protein [Polyangiaceae bacterium]
SMVWHLWQPEAARFQASADNPGGNDGAAYAAVGDEGMFKAVQSRRLVGGLNRGYERIDLVDFYDATSCEAVAPDQSVVSVSRDVGFPWDSAPLCP